MRSGSKKRLRTGMLLLVLLAVPIAGWVRFYAYPLWRLRERFKTGRERRMRLLRETDHDELLAACRGLLRRAAAGELRTGQYLVRVNRDPQAASFPRVILDLDPTYVAVRDDGSVIIDLYGSFDYFGVVALSEDYELGPTGKAGDVELIPGLWYYGSECDDDPKEARRIEALVRENRAK